MTHGCYNHFPLKDEAMVQDGWIYESRRSGGQMEIVRFPRMVRIPDPMSKDCQYSILTVDPQCDGCIHQNKTGVNKPVIV